MNPQHLIQRLHDSCHGGRLYRGLLQAKESSIRVIDAEYLYFATAEESWIAYAPSIGDCDEYATRYKDDWWSHWCEDMTAVKYENLPERTKKEITRLQEFGLLPENL